MASKERIRDDIIMNARETHLLKEQDKRDAQQMKAERVPPLVLFGVVRRSHKNSQKGYQKYEIEADVRQAELCDHAVRITLEDQGKVKKRRSKRPFFCTLHGTTCTPDNEGVGGCGDLVKECHWTSYRIYRE